MARYALRMVLIEVMKDAAAFRAKHPHPWLVCTNDLNSPDADLFDKTHTSQSGPVGGAPGIGEEPSALEIIKVPNANNFTLGITVGRTNNNDVMIPDSRVSRFHAYFQLTPSGAWAIADAESTNGTAVDDEKLEPRKAKVLPDEAIIAFGEFKVRFYGADAFVVYLMAP